ncbi:MAG: LuxR family transcriptional regulator [Herbiconiux sp.]|uniref:helix-turn-helix transcriptional regulator n=1 Tax=Herbiconiux sp. TaxID=1871186 RepID=UPI00122B3673|nr:LuxR family transcriptional regulator [Herbiconiux sp.]TAJ47912.1 MAG: LuxR family transcriptional regulator [Herbiconiux sp.]
MNTHVAHALAQSNWSGLIQAVEADWNALMEGDRDQLKAALNAIPADVLAEYPRMIAARDYVNFLPVAGVARPVRYRHSPSQPTSLMDVLADLTSRSATERFAGRFAEAAGLVHQAHSTIHDVPDEALVEIRPVLPDLRLQWAISLQFAGHLVDAVRAYERTYDEALVHASTRIAVEAAGSIAFNHALAGNIVEAERWLARMPDAVNDPTDTVHAMGCFARALIAGARLDGEGARAALDQAPSDSTSPEPWAIRMFVESRLAALTGDPRAQLTLLSSGISAHPAPTWSGGLNAWLLWVAQLELLLAAGDATGARALLATTPAIPDATQYNLPAVLRAWYLVRYGDADQAAASAASSLRDQPAASVSANMLAVLALVNQRRGRSADASRHFGTCLAIIARERLYEILLRLSPEERDEFDPTGLPAIPEDARLRIQQLSEHHDIQKPLGVTLSARERVVLRYLMDGALLTEIAAAEHVSVNTVKSQLRTLYRKLGVTERRHAVDLALGRPEIWA